jgi:ribosome-associated heat shock protein Hsp15
VVDLLEKRVGARLVENYLRDITPIEEVEKYKAYQSAQREYRQMGFGKPTKKDRRSIKKFLGD